MSLSGDHIPTDPNSSGSIDVHQQPGGHSQTLENQPFYLDRSTHEKVFNILQESSGTYISDIFSTGNDINNQKLLRELQKQCELSYRRGLLFICVDGDHIHLGHDCSYANKSCRCSFIQKTEALTGFRRRGGYRGKRLFCSELNLSDIKNIFTYFQKGRRRINYSRIGGHVERLPFEPQNMEIDGSEECRSSKPLETCPEIPDYELRSEEYDNSEGVARNRRGLEAVHQKKSNKRQTQSEKMLQLVKQHLCCPVRGILSLPVWLNHDQFKFLDESDKRVMNVFSNWEKTLCNWSLYDFQTLYSQPGSVLYFSAGTEDIFSYYYSLEDSLHIIIDLLEFQMDHDQELIGQFITDLYNVVERKVPKLNTFVLYAPSSSGKNYFLDCIKDYYLNVGKLQNATKHNNFSFQDAVYRRLNFWNEPNYSPDRFESLKELLGGDTTNTPVKHRSEGLVYRTPCLVATNRTVSFMTSPFFHDRIVQYNWQPYLKLKNYDKKPYPLTTFALFKHYGLIKELEYYDFYYPYYLITNYACFNP